MMKSFIIITIIIVVCFVLSEAHNESQCEIWRDPPACYCEFCAYYESCLSECTRRLENQAQIIKFQDGNFNKIQKTPTNLYFTNLKRITISSCGVEEVEKDFFHQFNVLDYATLIDNNIKDQKAPLKLNLPNTVTTLDLTHNSLQRFPQITSESLEELDLSCNKLTYLDSRQFKRLKTLKTLYLEGNKLVDIDFVKPMPKALTLHLERNRFPCGCRFYQMVMDNSENIYSVKGFKCVNGTRTIDFTDPSYARTLFEKECKRMPTNYVSSSAKMVTIKPLMRNFHNFNYTDKSTSGQIPVALCKKLVISMRVVNVLLIAFLVATFALGLKLGYTLLRAEGSRSFSGLLCPDEANKQKLRDQSVDSIV